MGYWTGSGWLTSGSIYVPPDSRSVWSLGYRSAAPGSLTQAQHEASRFRWIPPKFEEQKLKTNRRIHLLIHRSEFIFKSFHSSSGILNIEPHFTFTFLSSKVYTYRCLRVFLCLPTSSKPPLSPGSVELHVTSHKPRAPSDIINDALPRIQ